MSNRRERTIQDLCDATPTLSHPQITPVLSGNCKMQGPVDEANSNLLTHLLSPAINKGFSSCSDRSRKVDYSVKSGACNVCSTPCSSCFHVSKFMMKLSDGSAGETCAGNVVVGRGKRPEVGQISELSTVAGMNSTSNSFSENAVGKSSSRTSDASASDDNMTHSNFEGRRVSNGHDDCLSCISGTDEGANKKSDIEDGRIQYSWQNKITGDTSGKIPSGCSPAGLSSTFSGLVEIPSSNNRDATNLQLVNHTLREAFRGKAQSHNPSPRDIDSDNPSDSKGEILEGSSEHFNSLLTREVASDVVCGNRCLSALNSIQKDDDMEVENHSIGETDDSDMVEHDVKVCDICGDAGREELLAICCQCSDGAEHTYCMREMLEKVPEGDWLCEECNSLERMRNERQEKIGVDENEKNNSSTQASSEFLNSSDVEGQRTKSYLKTPGKRFREDADAEVSSIMKKPALESAVGSTKISNSSKTAFPRETSFKDLDKGRQQSIHHSSSDTAPVNDTVEAAYVGSDLRAKSFRGSFSKSNSFNSLTSKPKVKLVDQAVLQRQKSAKEHASFRLKEGVTRSIGKPVSFKYTNSGCSESKIKTVSPRAPRVQDVKNINQRSSFERQNSFKMEHPSISSMAGTSMGYMSRIDKKLASRGESSSHTSISNHHDIKAVQSDGKSTSLSRSSSITARQNADLRSSSGDFKRPLSHNPSLLVVSSVNGVNSTEPKSNQASSRENSSSCSVVTERPPFNANEALPDGSFRPRDLANSGERVREFSGNRFRPSSVKSLRDESNNIKAAIEAAVLKKPGVYRKQRTLAAQPDDLYMPSSSSEVASHQGNISSSAGKRHMSSATDLSERQTTLQNLNADSNKQEIPNNVKECSLLSVEGQPSGRGDAAHVTWDGNSSSRDVFSNVAAAIPFFLKSLAIPEHEYTWRGSFEICRSGKRVDFWDGIQAHLSTCASSKVIEAVNKFKSRIVLYEVPRLSTWPVQFQEHGVREDNIALFFFAKDLESYDKIYKVLLENMMKNDLALKGTVNGVELLIFPSNHLPDSSQRWNMLFFLWGVFRGKKESCQQHVPESRKQCRAPQDIPSAIMSLPENRCALPPITKDLGAKDDIEPVSKMPGSEESCCLLSSRVENGDSSGKVSSMDQLDCGPNPGSSPIGQIDSGKRCQDMTAACMEGGIGSGCRPAFQGMGITSSSGGEHMSVQLDHPVDRQHLSCHLNESIVGARDTTPQQVSVGKTILEASTSKGYQVNFRIDAKHPSATGETPEGNNRDAGNISSVHNRWLLQNNECLHSKSCLVPRTLYPNPGQGLSGNNDACDEPCGASTNMNHVATGSCALENRRHEACDQTLPEYTENAERHFFPIESQCVKPTQLVDGDVTWNLLPLEQDRLQDRAPNLELALGAETKPLTQGIRPLLLETADKKINGGCIPSEGGTKVVEDVSASLSLSLSFPFPEKEQSKKPAPKSEQLVSEGEHVTTSMLLFGSLSDTL